MLIGNLVVAVRRSLRGGPPQLGHRQGQPQREADWVEYWLQVQVLGDAYLVIEQLRVAVAAPPGESVVFRGGRRFQLHESVLAETGTAAVCLSADGAGCGVHLVAAGHGAGDIPGDRRECVIS